MVKTGTNKPRYSAVIPVYNEAGVLPVLYLRLKKVMDSLGAPYEMIFINDGSGDDSGPILKKLSSGDGTIVVINFKSNFGQHPAMASGYIRARGDIIISLDSDLQNPPEEIPKLIAELDKGYDMVSGFRGKRKDNCLRTLPSRLVNLIISTMTGVRMRDYGSGLRVFRAQTAKCVAREFMSRKVYISMLVPLVTKNVNEIEVVHDERTVGESKYGMFKLLSTFSRIFLFGGKTSPLEKDRCDSDDTWILSILKNGKPVASQDEI